MSGDSNSFPEKTPQRNRELLEKLLRDKAAQKQLAASEGTSSVATASSTQKLIPHVDRNRESFPLSFAQRRMWLLDQLEPGNPAYNLSVSIRLQGDLHVAVLSASITEVIRRHETLRTTFIMVDEAPAQVIHAPFTLSLPVVTAQAIDEHELQKLTYEESSRPFDLLNGPLVRVKLIKLDNTEHVFIFTFHHIISDGWSVFVFIRELQTLYQALVNSQTPALPDLTVQYVDYSLWQEEWLQGDVLETQLSYWKKQLAAPLPVLNLPTDFDRPKVQTYHGARETVTLSELLSFELKELSRNAGSTVFMTLLAAFDVLLYRLTGQSDVIVGSPIAGRSRSELEGLIGFFLNTLVMRVNLDGNPTFHELVQRTREVALQAYANQDVPFEKLLEELHPERHLNRTPVFQVFINMLNFNDGPVDFAGLKGEYVYQADTEARFDLTLYIREENKRINLTFVYNSDLFSQERIVELGRQLELLLEQIVKAPGQSIDTYSLLTTQARVILPDPAIILDEPKQALLADMISQWAKQTPNAVAIEKGHQGWTYQELEESATRLAQDLIYKGVKPGDVVAVSGSRSFNLIVSMLAVMKSGGVLLTVDNGLPVQRKKLMLEQASAKALVHVGDTHARDFSWVNTLDLLNVQILNDLSLNGSAGTDSSPILLPILHGDDPAYIFYTSGTTGLPKGVLGVHKGLGHFLRWQRDTFGIHPGDRAAQLTGLSFDVVLRDVFLALVSGATLCLPNDDIQLDVDETLNWLKEMNITIVHTVPTLAQTWLNSPTRLVLPNLGWIFFAGEPLYDSLVEKWRNCVLQGQIVNLYGPTETTLAKCYYPVPDRPSPGVQPVGRPLPQTQALVINRQGQLCGLGEPGEIVIRTPFRTRGYINMPEENQEKFKNNPFRIDEQDKVYFTGDQGRFRPDGALEILGRNDDQIKIRGLRVELGEIESALNQHSAVKQAVVIAAQGKDSSQTLIGYIVPNAAQFPNVYELKGHLQQYLPAYMIPTHFVLIDVIPFTPNGKVNKRALPEPDIQSLHESTFIAPQSQLQELLADIWAEVLHLEKVGIQDNFFELGGHSLLATQIMSRIRRAIHTELPLRILFEYPTIAALAAEIGTKQKKSDLKIPPITPRIHPAPPRLSFSQERMWFLHQLAPESSAYNMASSLQIQGELVVPAVQETFNRIIERHAILRTTFDVIDGIPVQMIASSKRVEIPTVDLQSYRKEEQESQTRQILRTQAAQPFDLVNGPLMRILIIQRGEQDYILFVCLHHIISDQWSGSVFLREFAAIYNALCDNNAIPLNALPIQYADYGSWQRDWLSGDVLQAKLSFWKEQLAGLSVLNLPTDYPRPAIQTFNGAVERLPLSPSVVNAIRNLCRQEKITPFMFFLSIFKILLLRYSGQRDIAVGSPIANRNWFETEALIGTFVNTVVLRTQLVDNPSFREFLHRIRETSLEAFNHQDFPFEKLVEELQPKRDLSHAPLVQVLFNVQNAPVNMPKLYKELVLTPLWPETRDAQFDLTLSITTDMVPNMVITYNTDLYKRETVLRLLGHVEMLAQNAIADPERSIMNLNLLTLAEREQHLQTWNDTLFEYPGAASIHELVERQAEKTPDAIAVEFLDQRLTYRELNSRANRLARHLQSLGVRSETPVGISMERSAEMVIGLLGILKAGGTYIPLDPLFPHERLEYMLDYSGIDILLTHKQPRAIATTEKLRKENLKFVHLDSDWQAISKLPDTNLNVGMAPENLAYILFTSGSTGKPKGVQILHRAVVNFLISMQQKPGLLPGDRLLSVTTLSFDISVLEIFLPLVTGALVVVLPGDAVYDGAALIRHLEASRISVMQATPATWQMIIDAGWQGDKHLKVLCGGEAMPKELARWLTDHAGSVWNMYGPTETTVWSTICEILPATDVITIGRPIANTRIYILDEHMAPVPVSVAGELCIAGDGVARGYLKQPELTAEKFIPDPFYGDGNAFMYKTGDQARYLSDGRIDFLGRADFQVKVRGFRIELGEIESVLNEHPRVRQAVVIAREDTPGDKRLVAYLITDTGESIEPDGLRQLIRKKLPDYMVPSVFVFLDEFPMTPNRKVNRKGLPVPGSIQGNTERELVLPRSQIEAKLVTIWEDLIKTKPISVKDDFFDLGGHSLLAVHLFSRIQKEFNVNLPLATLFRESTVEAIARLIQQESGQEIWSSLVEIEPQGDHLPFFCVHGLTGDILWFRDLASCLVPNYPFYGLQSRGLDGNQPPVEYIEQMAANYFEEIRRLQPKGPYYLGGASFGASVVLEMAQQILAQGEQVAILAIFDDGPGNVKTDTDARDIVRGIRLTFRLLKNIPQWFKEFRKLGPMRIFQRIRRKVRVVQKANSSLNVDNSRQFAAGDLIDFASELSEHRQRLITVNYQAIKQYIPKPYAGNVSLFRASTRPLLNTFDPEVGWQKLAPGRVNVIDVPSSHEGMFKQPYVLEFAKKLKACLDDACSEMGSK